MRSMLCKIKYIPKRNLFGANLSGTLYFGTGEMQVCYSVGENYAVWNEDIKSFMKKPCFYL